MNKNIKFLIKEIYENLISEINLMAIDDCAKFHWNYSTNRWKYHLKTIDIIKSLDIISNPKEVLEAGTMGIQIIQDSDTIDYKEKWNIKEMNNTYTHNLLNIPWPIRDNQYKIFIALRVFHHLQPKIKECIQEAQRISKYVILTIPQETIPRHKIDNYINGYYKIYNAPYGPIYLLYNK